MLKWLVNLISETDEKKLKKLLPLIDQINAFEESFKKLSDEELKNKTVEFRSRLAAGTAQDDLLPEAFAAVREASVRTIGLRHFDTQLLGGIVLHQGMISEMKTGEGKTLVATLPIYLNALSGKGVHLVTVNDYLARRDSEWMGPVYSALGLSVGVIQHHHEYKERQEAYACDITYGTNNEFGFDYLRDHMAFTVEQCVQRELNYAIVDEVDSILIDEARTPLIISGVVEDTLEGFQKANQLARKMVKTTDFETDEKSKNATLTEAGVHKLEKLLNVEYLFDVQHMSIAHQILQSLKAWYMYQVDVDYVVKDGEIIIVDEFTGRLMFGRRYSDGLHQAIEAKENVRIQEESQTLATITFQNYFRLYNKLGGMTGTAKTEEGEFWKIYKLAVMEIPTNRPMVRKDSADIIFKTRKGKFQAVVGEIIELQKKGQPVLVGTVSIENSEYLSSLLKRRGIVHEVLNAKHHEREAEIIAKAGQKNTVTISTNMAGRGTDIVLGEGVKELGGLHILGTERHESRRIDNQLRGRSGRQGDPGTSRFYVSLEDDLMRLFGSKRVQDLMDRWGITEEIPIENRLISGFIEKAQKKVEDYYFGIRKSVLEYDDVMNKQRDTIYRLRRRILEVNELKEKIFEFMDGVVERLMTIFAPEKTESSDWDWEGMIKALKDITPVGGFDELTRQIRREGLKEEILTHLKAAYDLKENTVGSDMMRNMERAVMLRVLDAKWIEQLDNMDTLRDGIGLRAYGQRDPLVEYKIEGYGMFQEMMETAADEIITMLFKVQLVREDEPIAPVARNITLGAPAESASAPSPIHKSSEIGRNEPCPCGSGKKYKKCCMLKDKKS